MRGDEKRYYVVVLEKIDEKTIWGIGESEDEAYDDCLKNLRESFFADCRACSRAVFDFVKRNGGQEAMRNAFLSPEDDTYYLMPSHDALSDFCTKYHLPVEAREEIRQMFDFLHSHG